MSRIWKVATLYCFTWMIGRIWTPSAVIPWHIARCAGRLRPARMSPRTYFIQFSMSIPQVDRSCPISINLRYRHRKLDEIRPTAGRPIMSYIDQFVQPKDFEEGNWLADMSDSLENSQHKV